MEYCKNILKVKNNCSECLLCTTICPNGTIFLMDKKITFIKDSNFCGLCISICPEDAIEKI